jgi:hypothetical protein
MRQAVRTSFARVSVGFARSRAERDVSPCISRPESRTVTLSSPEEWPLAVRVVAVSKSEWGSITVTRARTRTRTLALSLSPYRLGLALSCDRDRTQVGSFACLQPASLTPASADSCGTISVTRARTTRCVGAFRLDNRESRSVPSPRSATVSREHRWVFRRRSKPLCLRRPQRAHARADPPELLNAGPGASSTSQRARRFSSTRSAMGRPSGT